MVNGPPMATVSVKSVNSNAVRNVVNRPSYSKVWMRSPESLFQKR